MPGKAGFSERLSPLLDVPASIQARCRMVARLWGMPALLALAVLVLAACQSTPTPAPSPIPTPTPASTPTTILPPSPPPTLTPTPPPAHTPAPTALPSPTLPPTPTPVPTLTPTPSPYTGYLTEEIPPCTPVAGSSVDPCGSRPTTMLVSQVWWLLTGLRIAFDISEIETIEGSFRRDLTGVPPGVEQQIGAVGLNEPPFYDFVTHVVARVTFLPGTERCTSNATFRRALYDESLLPSTSSTWAVQCFADVRVNSYILGKGSPRLTVQTGLYIGIPEFLEYALKDAEGKDISAEEFMERMRDVMEYSIVHGDVNPHYETGSGSPTSYTLTGGVRGKEVVLFLGPSINHATEAWQVLETWDVKRKSDGTVVAVHPHREAWLMSRDYSSAVYDPLLEVELPRFKQEVAEASQARLAAYGGRIGADFSLPLLVFDTNDLRWFMISAGSYDHPDSPPMPPPPIPSEDDPVPTATPTPESTAVSTLTPTAAPPPNSPATDREVLVALYNDTRGNNWGNNWNWMSDRPLDEWPGVTANTEGRVTYLDLSLNGLNGEIPRELGNLSNLEGLDLSHNRLGGGMPPELGKLANLKVLNLGANELNGEIPPELGNLTNLEELNLSINQLSGEIPPELGNLSGLKWLGLSGNQLSGEIPLELGNLVNLERLGLDNQFSCIPAGMDPTQVWSRIFGLPICDGSTPTSTPIPTPISSAEDREVLAALYNATDGRNWGNNWNWMSDRPLGEWYGVTANTEGRVTYLDLSFNDLSGEIPPELGNLANLEWLDLGINQLDGRIPPELGNLANLEWLDLRTNQLDGRIPPELGNLANLEHLNLTDNQLSGEIPPELGNLSGLKWLGLTDNQLSREIPPELGRPRQPGRVGPRHQPAERRDTAGVGQTRQSGRARPLLQRPDRGGATGAWQSRQPGSAVPRRKPTQWGDTTGTGQTCQTDSAIPRRQPAERGDAAGTGQSR